MATEEQNSEKTDGEPRGGESEERLERDASPGGEVPFHIPRD